MPRDIAGFDFSGPSSTTAPPLFDYKNVLMSRFELATRPPLAWSAPELVLGASPSAASGGGRNFMDFDGGGGARSGVPSACACDAFSLGLLAYRLVAGASLLQVSNDLNALSDYKSQVRSMR